MPKCYYLDRDCTPDCMMWKEVLENQNKKFPLSTLELEPAGETNCLEIYLRNQEVIMQQAELRLMQQQHATEPNIESVAPKCSCKNHH